MGCLFGRLSDREDAIAADPPYVAGLCNTPLEALVGADELRGFYHSRCIVLWFNKSNQWTLLATCGPPVGPGYLHGETLNRKIAVNAKCGVASVTTAKI